MDRNVKAWAQRSQGMWLATLWCVLCLVSCEGHSAENTPVAISLPSRVPELSKSVNEALRERRSIREFKKDAWMDLEELGALLWAAQGRVERSGKRTAPSAGALYPLDVYVVSTRVKDLAAGVYHYEVVGHGLKVVSAGEKLKELTTAALDQQWINDAAAVIVLTGEFARSAGKYGDRAQRYTMIECGLAAENVYLEATMLNLGTTFVGAFDDAEVQQVLGLPVSHEPLGLLPVGVPVGRQQSEPSGKS